MSDIVSYTVPVTSGGTTTDTTLYFKDADLRDNVDEVKEYIGYVPPKVIGLQADFENSTFTRLGDAIGLSAGSDFDQFSMYGGRRLCNLADDGTVNAWYGESGYTEDGSNGQVMVYQPKFYYKVVPLKIQAIEKATSTDIPEGYHLLKANYYICAEKKGGFKVHPAFFDGNGNEVDGIYISAYEGSLFDVSENKYLIYDDMEPAGDGTYTQGVYLLDKDNDKLCSIAGVKPVSGLKHTQFTRTNLEQIAQNRGSRWHGETVQVISMKQLLMVIEYGAFNMQTAIGAGVTGITDVSTDSVTVQTGATSSLGEGTGIAESTDVYISTGHKTGSRLVERSVRYRGVENDWGNIYKFINGLNIWGDGKRKGGIPYYCENFSFAESKKTDNYKSMAFTLTNTDDYIRYFGWSHECDWAFLPSKTGSGASSNIPVGDHILVKANLNGYRIAFLGGFWDDGYTAGPFSGYTYYGADRHISTIGARIFFV